MQEKLKQLELLVSQVMARRKEAEAQNAALRQRVRQLEESAAKLREAESELKPCGSGNATRKRLLSVWRPAWIKKFKKPRKNATKSSNPMRFWAVILKGGAAPLF